MEVTKSKSEKFTMQNEKALGKKSIERCVTLHLPGTDLLVKSIPLSTLDGQKLVHKSLSHGRRQSTIRRQSV
jgi:hypothetical protein